MKIVFFGSSKFVIPIIEVLQKNFNLCLVATTEKLPTDPVVSYCIKTKVCYYVVTDFRNKKILQELKKTNASLGILASFGAILPDEILSIFPLGIINIHPSLLPKYRGPTPVQTAILNGEKITGVTIIKLDDQVDHGPILTQKEVRILPNETSESLYKRLFSLAASSMVQIIELYINGEISLREQNHRKATFTKSLAREDGFIDLKNPLTPQTLERMIRAYYPWPGVWTELRIKNKELRIKFLPGKKIQVEGKKPVSVDTFKKGYPKFRGWLEKALEKRE